ncbi:MAG TPA: cytochrome c maturation protein CcmE [Polyangiaceae bacterium]|jgi:cytochrome c-type biogenesis protein CcmE|nr:cytochrome c maturation protein CcmE [Polyangiaceae bacterium]
MSASNVDRELERALGSSPRAGAEGVGRGSAALTRKGNVRLLVVLLVMTGGIVALVMTSFKDAAVYSKNVDQVLAEGRSLGARQLRVEGNLVHGSLTRREQPCEYRFTIKGKEAVLPVSYAKCIVPDTFRDVPNMDLGVTVEGKLGANGQFEATQVLAKCPSKYEMKEKQARGEEMPHDLPPQL